MKLLIHGTSNTQCQGTLLCTWSTESILFVLLEFMEHYAKENEYTKLPILCYKYHKEQQCMICNKN